MLKEKTINVNPISKENVLISTKKQIKQVVFAVFPRDRKKIARHNFEET